jgi:beta-glucosidase
MLGMDFATQNFVNAWPSGLQVGASWNRDLTYQRGLHMGGEFKTKGVHVALGPVVGPLGRKSLGVGGTGRVLAMIVSWLGLNWD